MTATKRLKSGRQRPEWAVWLERLVYRFMPLILAALVFIVYLLTMAPRLTWEHAGRDGGDLISAAKFLGVPHPPGYPTYTMLAWFFTRIPFGSIAWRVHLLSALAGSGAVALTYLIGLRASADRTSRWSVLGSAAGALLLAFAPLFWGHSLIAEVYTLHLFFIALILWLMLRWRDGEGALPVAALLYGVGLGNRVTLTFMAPLILLLLWSGRERLSWRQLFLSAAALLLGLSVYLYLPWRASADPVINWGDPDTWEGFQWMVTGRGYRRFVFALPFDELLARLEEWGTITRAQFPLLAWPIAILGLWNLARRDPWLGLGTALHALINLVYGVFYNTTDAFVHLLPVYLYLALWTGQGTAVLADAVNEVIGPARRPALIAALITAAMLALPLISLIQEWDGMDLTNDRAAETYAREALEGVEPGSLILVESDAHTFALWYYRYVEEVRPDVAVVNRPMLTFEWYQNTVAVHHPDVLIPDPGISKTKLNTVLGNLDRRPIYIAEDEGDLDDLILTPVGPLFRVTSP